MGSVEYRMRAGAGRFSFFHLSTGLGGATRSADDMTLGIELIRIFPRFLIGVKTCFVSSIRCMRDDDVFLRWTFNSRCGAARHGVRVATIRTKYLDGDTATPQAEDAKKEEERRRRTSCAAAANVEFYDRDNIPRESGISSTAYCTI
ncbi:hypothetical protein U1Q18_050770 [Sarracenia purpurea var. burkii]